MFCFNLIVSQTTEVDLHKKYWYYKSRFNNDFIKVGKEHGESIPFNQSGLEVRRRIWPGYS